MKVAVINFSGNVGKTTIARHLLAPRIPDADFIAVESINADEGQERPVRGNQFGELQEYLQTVDNAVVDIGASNVEDLLSLMAQVPRQPRRLRLLRRSDRTGAQATAGHHRHAHAADPAGRPGRQAEGRLQPGRGRRQRQGGFRHPARLRRAKPRCPTCARECRLGANEIYERVKGNQTPWPNWPRMRPTTRD